jgi:hypothetical protein
MTQCLRDVFTLRLTKEGFQKYFYDELVELLNDEDLLVRIEAIEVAVEVMQSKMLPEQIEKDLLPVFVKHLEILDDVECTLKMSSLFGKFLFNLSLEKQRKAHAKTFIEFFNKICRS